MTDSSSGQKCATGCNCSCKSKSRRIFSLEYLAIMGLLLFAFFLSEKGYKSAFYVNRPFVNYRAEPKGEILGQFKKGKEIYCDGFTNGWCQMTFEDKSVFVSLQVLSKHKPKK